jgi:hypothetical protein
MYFVSAQFWLSIERKIFGSGVAEPTDISRASFKHILVLALRTGLF